MQRESTFLSKKLGQRPKLVGAGSFTTAVLRALIRTPPPAGGTRTVTVHADGSPAVQKLVERFGSADSGTTVRVASAADPPSDTELVVVSRGADEGTLSEALQLSRTPGLTVVAAVRRADPFAADLARTPHLTIFGILDAACDPEPIGREAVLGRAARAIHIAYVANCRAAGKTPADTPAMRDWSELEPYLQESNYAQAEHIGAKLAEIPAELSTAPPVQPFAFTAGELLRLAEQEHERWVAERTRAGFRVGKVRDDPRKLHPDLVDWAELPEDSRRKDVDAVRQLPELLAAAGLYITRTG